MKPKTMILMVVAVVCGLGASYMTSRLLAERDDKPADAPAAEKVTLLIAKKNIEMATALKTKPEDFFLEKQMLKEDAPKDALTAEDVVKLKNKFLKRALRKGDHVVADDLTDNKSGLTNLPNGMRAIGISVNASMSAGNFANLPGSHVDIMWTTRARGDKDTFSKVLLENVIVLAADAMTGSETGGAVAASVVTVALHPEDAMKLTLAMESGSLRLVVRNFDDYSTTDKVRYSTEDLMRDSTSKQKKPGEVEVAAAPVPPPPVELEPKVEPEVKPKEVPPPAPKVTKMTVIVRNGGEVSLHHYWVDEDDQIVPGPQGGDADPVPQPSPSRPEKKK